MSCARGINAYENLVDDEATQPRSYNISLPCMWVGNFLYTDNDDHFPAKTLYTTNVYPAVLSIARLQMVRFECCQKSALRIEIRRYADPGKILKLTRYLTNGMEDCFKTAFTPYHSFSHKQRARSPGTPRFERDGDYLWPSAPRYYTDNLYSRPPSSSFIYDISKKNFESPDLDAKAMETRLTFTLHTPRGNIDTSHWTPFIDIFDAW